MRLSSLTPRRLISRPLRQGDRSGVTAVEFAMVAPIFFLVVFICIEFCRLNMIRNLTQDAAYFAARDCIVPGASADEAIAAANHVLSLMNTRAPVSWSMTISRSMTKQTKSPFELPCPSIKTHS